MTDITFTSELNVELVDYMGSDESVVRTAKVSTLNDFSALEMTNAEIGKFIDFLMRNRHGSPFEHNSFTWRIEAPIFMWREFMRHRIASYNEQSGRYTVMPPKFYIPDPDRNLVQVGKPGAYEFVPGSHEQYHVLIEALQHTCGTAYRNYEEALGFGIAKEVARMALPLNLFSIAYVTMNARGLMNFLSLRVKSEDSKYLSFPMWEINQVANKMELSFMEKMPLTHESFVANGRVQP